MPCEYCKEPDGSGDYNPCCDDGTCEAAYTEGTISICIHCGAEMHKEEETGYWRHHTQMDLPIEERDNIHLMEHKEDNL